MLKQSLATQLSFKHICTAIFACCLAACSANTPTKSSSASAHIENTNANTLYERGVALYNNWLSNENDSEKELTQALHYFDAALKLNPDNIRFQLDHYNALASVLSMKNEFDEARLLTSFKQLHPAIQSDAITPAFVSYSRSQYLKNAEDIQLSHIRRAISQNPRNAQNWTHLSQEYTQSKQAWLAAASAKQALELIDEVAEYHFQVSRSLVQIADSRSCASEETPIIKQALKHLRSAMKLEPENTRYIATSAYQYSLLGLAPLALSQAKKAFTAEPSFLSAREYFRNAIISKQFAAAEAPLKFLEEKYASFAALELALWYWHEKKFDKIADQLIAADGVRHTHFHALASAYILNDDSNEYDGLLAEVRKHPNRTNAQLYDYMNVNSTLEDDVLIDAAENACEKSEYLFFKAIRLWREGDIPGHRKILESIAKNGTPREPAALWARMMLGE